ncbi:hypothetical protein IWZ00DRAFT_163853 [Phyllosticta capitalensis]|uniref:F-box domain-containing protein n=1 Tax=Phyllosticta capitalensis TaxID=121624 RepID=A0ABR1YZ21_9PEZI
MSRSDPGSYKLPSKGISTCGLQTTMDCSETSDSRPPRGTASDQAALDLMPAEIFEQITDYLDLTDILSLRQVSKSAERLCIPRFARSCIDSMGWAPDSIWEEDDDMLLWIDVYRSTVMEVVATPRGLQKMRRLPRIQEILATIKTLSIHIYAGADEDGLEYWHSVVREECKSQEEPTTDTLLSLQDYMDDIAIQESELAAIESHSDVECFREAFEMFENLETVKIENLRVRNAKDLRWETWRYYSAASISREISRVSSAVLTAMAQTNNKISSLTFGDLQLWHTASRSGSQFCKWICDSFLMRWTEEFGACEPAAFDFLPACISEVPSNFTTFTSLRSLRATISGTDGESLGSLGKGPIQNLQGLGKLLRACPNLTKLHLDALKRTVCIEASSLVKKQICNEGILHPTTAFLGPSAISELAQSFRHGQLEHLYVSDFVAHPRDFAKLLDSQKPSLRMLKVSNGHLIEGEWAHCYKQLLDGFSLKELLLGPLFQLNRDHYKRSLLCDPPEWYRTYAENCWFVHDNTQGVEEQFGESRPDPQEALSALLENEKFDVGYYPSLSDLLNTTALGFPMDPTDPDALSALVRQFSEDYFGIDTSYDLSWLFGQEVLSYVKDWKEDPTWQHDWW